MGTENAIVAHEVKNFILQEFLTGADPDELTMTTPLLDSGILDSMAMIKLVVFLEDRFNVTVEVDAELLATISSIAKAVESKK